MDFIFLLVVALFFPSYGASHPVQTLIAFHAIYSVYTQKYSWDYSPDLFLVPSTSLIVRFALLIILPHNQPSSLIPTLLIESLILNTATQDTLVATNSLGYRTQRLYHFQAKLFALLVFLNGDLFNVCYTSQPMNASFY